MALRILGVAPKVSEKGVPLRVGEKAASHFTPLVRFAQKADLDPNHSQFKADEMFANTSHRTLPGT